MSVPTISKSILTDRNSVYQEQSVIEIVISPEEVPLLNSAQGTYLKFLLQVDDTATVTNCLAQPDPMAGGSSVIQTISIYSMGGQLLEQLEDVNTWTAMYYHYSKTQGLSNMRTLLEGMSPVVGSALTSQYWRRDNATAAVTYTPVECVVPLYMSGLLGQDNGKLLPIVALNGIRVRIQLAKKAKALRALTQKGYSSSSTAYVGIRQIEGLPIAGQQPAQTFCTATTIAAAATPVPFIDLNTVVTDAAPVLPLIQAGVTVPSFTNVAYQIGQEMFLEEDGGAALNLGAITAISIVAGRCRYTFAAPGVAPVAQITAGNKVWVNGNSLRCGFNMSNVELICSVVQADGKTISGLMNQVQSGGGIRIDYPSYNLYRQNLQAGIPRSELLIPCTEQRAMSIVSEPMRSIDELYEDTLRPVGDAMKSYIWNIANRLTPNRRVDVAKVASTNADQSLQWDSIHLHETEKAIGRCEIAPRNLCENARCFAVSRELAKAGHSFNANLNEIRLNVEYGSTATENVVNKLVDTWLYHIRTVTITPNSVAVDF